MTPGVGWPPLPGEDVTTARTDDAEHWSEVYRQLAEFSRGASIPQTHLRYEGRHAFWRTRAADLAHKGCVHPATARAAAAQHWTEVARQRAKYGRGARSGG